MKNNKYTRALDSVHISDSALENGLKYAEESLRNGRKDKVIYMKKWKMATAAACLVLTLAAVKSITPGFEKKPTNDEEKVSNSFVLTANAEVLTSHSEVVIGLLDGIGGGFGTLDNGHYEIVKHMQFPIICEGTGIESVTYSLPEHSEGVQMTFVMQESFEKLVEHNGDLNAGYKTIFMPNTYTASQYTIPYDLLPEADDFGKRENGYHSDPVILDLCFEGDPKDMGFDSAEEMFESREELSAWASIFTETAERYSDEMKINVTANFEDGTSKTETVRLSCADIPVENDFTHVQIVGTIESENEF